MADRYSKRIQNIKKSFIREILKATNKPGMISFAGGLPNPISFPVKEIKQATEKVLDDDGANVLQYSTTEGYAPLREYISSRYKKRFDIDIPIEEILITSGSQQALDLVAKVFLDKGDKVLIEKPGYLGMIQSISVFEPEFVEVGQDDDGIIVDEFIKAIAKHDPKLFYCVPNFQNPTGLSYSEKLRQKIAKTIKSSNTILIEDDPYGELRFIGEHASSFKSLAYDNVITLGSFSKIVSPGMRLGWICAPANIMDKLITVKQAADLHTNYFAQRVLYQYLSDNDIDIHIAKINKLYKTQRDCMVETIDKYFPDEVNITKPQGGMFLWVTLPDGISSVDVFNKAYEQNIAFVPGSPFYASDGVENTFRLNYSNSNCKLIKEGMKKLGDIIKEHIAGINN